MPDTHYAGMVPYTDHARLQGDFDTLKARADRLGYILRELSNGGWLDLAPAALRREAESLVFNFNGMD